MKKYTAPKAEKLVFNYTENITASDTSSFIHHGDMGIEHDMSGGCDHNSNHGNPHTPHPGNNKP